MRYFLALLLFFLVTPCAFSQGFGLSASVGNYSPQEHQYNVEGGMGFDIRGFYQFTKHIQIGAGMLRSSHSTNLASGNVVSTFIFAEPQIRFPIDIMLLEPFIGGRIGWTQQRVTEFVSETSASGPGYGAFGGVSLNIHELASISISAHYLAFSLGDFGLDGNREGEPRETSTSLGYALGLSLTLP